MTVGRAEPHLHTPAWKDLTIYRSGWKWPPAERALWHEMCHLLPSKSISPEFLLWLSRLRTWHSVCEDVDSNPGLAQWVRELRIWHCCGCGVDYSCSSDSTPSLGTSICHRCGPKKKKKKRITLHTLRSNGIIGFIGFMGFCLFVCLFLGHACSVWTFPGQGLNQSCRCQPTPQPRQFRIRAVSATYTTAHGNAGALTHWADQGWNLRPHGYQ